MRNYIEILCNFYSKLKKIFAQLSHDFHAKNFDWKPYSGSIQAFPGTISSLIVSYNIQNFWYQLV